MHILAAPKNTKYKPLLWLFSSVLLFSFFYIPAHAENPSNLTVTAKVNFTCTIKVHPEKRVPIVNHWMNRNIVENSFTFLLNNSDFFLFDIFPLFWK